LADAEAARLVGMLEAIYRLELIWNLYGTTIETLGQAGSCSRRLLKALGVAASGGLHRSH
jgi:hypothetical protein